MRRRAGATEVCFRTQSMRHRIMKLYEVQHFEKKSNTLFKEYIKRFLKIKLETSS